MRLGWSSVRAAGCSPDTTGTPRRAQAVNQRPLTTEGQLPSRDVQYEFCGGKSGTRTRV